MLDIYDFETALDYLRDELIVHFGIFLAILGLFLLIWVMLKYPMYDVKFIDLFTKYLSAIGSGDEKKKKKYSKRMKSYSGDMKGLLVAGIVCALLMLLYIVPLMLDVYTESVIVYEGEYTVEEIYYSPTSYYAVVTIDGTEHKLQLNDMMRFPQNGESSGVIIYSKYTKQLLYYSETAD